MFITLDQLKRSLVATKEYISTTKSQLQALIPTKVSDLQDDVGFTTTPDWNQNDSSASDFIKNRICYIEDPTDVTIIKEMVIQIDDTQFSVSAKNLDLIDFDYYGSVGYRVQFGTDVYEGNFNRHDEQWVFGNLYLIDENSSDTNEPFFGSISSSNLIRVTLKEPSSGVNFSAQIIDYPVIRKIDDKYLQGSLLLKGKGEKGRIINDGYANGYGSVAESGGSAIGYYSHAEILGTAQGNYSHAEGRGTIAKHAYQHVFGTNNIVDSSTADTFGKGTYVEIVGNGTGNSNSLRSNARTLDWSGNEVLAGKLTVGAAPTANMDVATKKYVDDAVSGGGSAVTYTLSMTNNIITLTGSDGSTSSVTLPVYTGGVTS